MKFIDLFAGVGGFHYGFERANDVDSEQLFSQSRGWNENKKKKNEQSSSITSSKGGQNSAEFCCVWGNEWDKYAGSVYQKNFKETDFFGGDIRTVDVDRIPKHDLLCAGFPCQAFSIAGRRKGFDDTRGTLFFEIARILEAKRPRLVLLENVKGLLSHDNGRTFATILDTICELGYWVEWEVLNSKNFGVPQNRERVFIVGHLGRKRARTIFPLGENGEVNAGNFGYSKEACAVTSTYNKGGKGSMIELTQGNSQGYRIYSPDGISQTLAGESGGLGAKTGLYIIPLKTNTKLGYDLAEQGDGIRLQFENSKTARGRVIKGNSQALQTSGQVGTLIGNKIRRLTPVECERLQGFPDNWTKYGKNGEKMSDTQRYKMMGNAVTTNVITAIAEKIKEVENMKSAKPEGGDG